LIADNAGKSVWQWNSDPFGVTLANADPDGDGVAFNYNLRFPGQYFDSETRLHYNYFRDYNPSTGRYIESDPIGLAGGLNTFGYVGGNPLSFVDLFGLDPYAWTYINWKGEIVVEYNFQDLHTQAAQQSVIAHENVHEEQLVPYIGIPFGHVINNLLSNYDLDELAAYKKQAQYIQRRWKKCNTEEEAELERMYDIVTKSISVIEEHYKLPNSKFPYLRPKK
jgi:RHS repeat-associated protein